MFRTDICRDLVNSIQEKTSNVIELIQEMNLEEAARELESIVQNVTNRIETFSDELPDEVFNEGYILKQFIKCLEGYVSYWKLLVSDKYSDSWSTLQDIQDHLRTVYRFTSEPRPMILSHIEKQCGELEKLYPYNVFMSTGFIKEEAICSLCGKPVDSFECAHIAGELYRGRPAYGIVKKADLQEVSFVLNPADKRCVVQYPDTAEQFKLVAYFAAGLRDKVIAPLDFHHLDSQKIRKTNEELRKVSRNSFCPCGSGKKFKKCCIEKSYIETTHFVIIPEKITLSTLLQ